MDAQPGLAAPAHPRRHQRADRLGRLAARPPHPVRARAVGRIPMLAHDREQGAVAACQERADRAAAALRQLRHAAALASGDPRNPRHQGGGAGARPALSLRAGRHARPPRHAPPTGSASMWPRPGSAGRTCPAATFAGQEAVLPGTAADQPRRGAGSRRRELRRHRARAMAASAACHGARPSTRSARRRPTPTLRLPSTSPRAARAWWSNGAPGAPISR